MAVASCSAAPDQIVYTRNAPSSPAYATAASASAGLHEVVVRLWKPTVNHPLGVFVTGGGDGAPPVILKVRGIARSSGLLCAGDLLLAVNDRRVADHATATALIRAAPDAVAFRLLRPTAPRKGRLLWRIVRRSSGKRLVARSRSAWFDLVGDDGLPSTPQPKRGSSQAANGGLASTVSQPGPAAALGTSSPVTCSSTPEGSDRLRTGRCAPPAPPDSSPLPALPATPPPPPSTPPPSGLEFLRRQRSLSKQTRSPPSPPVNTDPIRPAPAPVPVAPSPPMATIRRSTQSLLAHAPAAATAAPSVVHLPQTVREARGVVMAMELGDGCARHSCSRRSISRELDASASCGSSGGGRGCRAAPLDADCDDRDLDPDAEDPGLNPDVHDSSVWEQQQAFLHREEAAAARDSGLLRGLTLPPPVPTGCATRPAATEPAAAEPATTEPIVPRVQPVVAAEVAAAVRRERQHAVQAAADLAAAEAHHAPSESHPLDAPTSAAPTVLSAASSALVNGTAETSRGGAPAPSRKSSHGVKRSWMISTPDVSDDDDDHAGASSPPLPTAHVPAKSSASSLPSPPPPQSPPASQPPQAQPTLPSTRQPSTNGGSLVPISTPAASSSATADMAAAVAAILAAVTAAADAAPAPAAVGASSRVTAVPTRPAPPSIESDELSDPRMAEARSFAAKVALAMAAGGGAASATSARASSTKARAEAVEPAAAAPSCANLAPQTSPARPAAAHGAPATKVLTPTKSPPPPPPHTAALPSSLAARILAPSDSPPRPPSAAPTFVPTPPPSLKKPSAAYVQRLKEKSLSPQQHAPKGFGAHEMPPTAPLAVSKAPRASGAADITASDAGVSDAATEAAAAAAIAALAALANGTSAPLGSSPYTARDDGQGDMPSGVQHHGRSARRDADAGGVEGLSFEAWLAQQSASPTGTGAQETEPTGGDAAVGGGTVRLRGSAESRSPDGEEERALTALRQLQRMHQPDGNGTLPEASASARDEATVSPDDSGRKGSFLSALQISDFQMPRFRFG